MFVIKELNDRHLAYLHLIEARGSEIGLTDELHENAVNNAVLFRSYSTDRCSSRKNPIM
jgi:N-ethylmaleimide reductase